MAVMTRIGALLLLLGVALQAEAFQMQRFNGERTSLLDHVGDGRWTLVMFWSTDCIPCEQQKPMLEDFHQAHANGNARVLGVALDGIDAMDELQVIMQRHQPSYDNLIAFPDVIHQQFAEATGQSFRATPTYLLYKPSGELMGVHVGPIERQALEQIIAG